MRWIEKGIAWLGVLLLLSGGSAALKVHTVGFGRWMTVKALVEPSEESGVDLKIRGLFVDGVLKSYTLGAMHEITDRQFAIQRIVRVNDELPSERSASRWVWKRSGWVMVDRGTGHITQLVLPEFDAELSAAEWYRDYIAYCGVSDEGDKLYAIVVQVGRRKPLVKKVIADMKEPEDLRCGSPVWERQPVRVTFSWKSDQKATYTIRGRAFVLREDEEEDDTE